MLDSSERTNLLEEGLKKAYADFLMNPIREK